jgi:hypothetical protein
MPEEILRYRVEIDQADLATQLAGIKNQIDTSLGSFVFNSLVQEPLADNSLIGRLGNFMDFGSTSLGHFHESMLNLQNILSQGIETSRLGFQKFTRDLELAGLIAPPSYIARNALTPEVAVGSYIPPTLMRYGTIRLGLARGLGLGYDPNMPITRAEYLQLAEREFGDRIVDTAVTGLSIAGAVYGLAGASALAGPIGLATVGLGIANYLIDAGAFEYTAVRNFGAYIERASMRNVGRLSNAEAREAASYIRNLSEDITIRAAVGNATDVEQVVTQAIGAGMFLDTANVEQFKQRARETLENFRTVQYAMRTTTEEALKIMSELMFTGVGGTTVQQVTNFIGQARSLGEVAGFSTREMLQLARQGAEMVRGTGREMRLAGLETMQLIPLVRQFRGSVFDEELIRQLGGEPNVALNLQRIGYEFANTLPGRFLTLAEMGGYDLSQGFNLGQMMTAAVSRLGGGTPEEILRMKADLRRQENETSAMVQNLRLASLALGTMRTYFGIENPSDEILTQYLIDQMGLSPQDAQLITETTNIRPEAGVVNFLRERALTQARIAGEEPGVLRRFTAGVGA